MADRIAVMNEGHLQAAATPDDLYDRPETLFVAGFIGSPPMNFIVVEVVRENGDYHARREAFDLVVPAEQGEKAAGKGSVILGIRPEDVTLQEDGAVEAEIYVVEPLGRDDLLDCRFGGAAVRVLADPKLRVRIGAHVRLAFDIDKVQFFDPETERSLLWG